MLQELEDTALHGHVARPQTMGVDDAFRQFPRRPRGEQEFRDRVGTDREMRRINRRCGLRRHEIGIERARPALDRIGTDDDFDIGG